MMQLNKDERLENMYFLIQTANKGRTVLNE